MYRSVNVASVQECLMPEDKVPVKKRRFLAKDYDFIAEFIKGEFEKRRSLQARQDHEMLWKEVDRQARMKPMEIQNPDPDMDWKNALEMGDISTASEVLTADVLRLIFPQDRKSLAVHTDIQIKRLQARSDKKIPEKEIAKIQRKADSELRALMTQQHKDFGFKERLKYSLKEGLHHGSLVAEVDWEAIQQYAMGGVFKEAESPVWIPHSMWKCYPETNYLNANMIYTGSMIIEEDKDYDWVVRQNHFINRKKLKDKVTNQKEPIKLLKFFGNITVRREGDDVYLPNMKIIVAMEHETVLFAKPMDNISIIYRGYDPVDVTDPYYLSPLVKQSTNQRILTILANKFLDAVDLKLEPPGVYDGNDPTMVQEGGPKIIPGYMVPTKGAVQNVKWLDVGDPSWAQAPLQFFKQEIQTGTGVSNPRAGMERQADRVTATQIEEESASGQVRTVDFVETVEIGIEAFCYIQHQLNRAKLKKYKVYNPDMGMPDFDDFSKSDLPEHVHFEMIGSKGVLTERRRAAQTTEVTFALLGNERTADLVNTVEVARQMYQDAGQKNPERLLNLSEDNEQMARAIQLVQARMEEMVTELNDKVKELTAKVTDKSMQLQNANDRLQLRNERAEGMETHLRNEIRALKAQMTRSAQFMEEIGDLTDEVQKNEKLKKEIENLQNAAEPQETTSENNVVPIESAKPVIQPMPAVNLDIERPGGFVITRDENGDMAGVIPVDNASEVPGK